jgi:hypothetical protein
MSRKPGVNAPDLVVLWGRQGQEPHALFSVAQADAVECEGVEMELRFKASPKRWMKATVPRRSR